MIDREFYPPTNPKLWKYEWGNEFDTDRKKWFSKKLLQLDRTGKLGTAILDVGSGAHPVSEVLRNGTHKIIEVDVGGTDEKTENKIRITYNIDKISDQGSLATRKSLFKAAKFLEIDMREDNQETIDTMIFSDVLNYVNYELVLNGLSRYLKLDGRFIIFNIPGHGYWELFSNEGLRDNEELFHLLGKQGFSVETLQRDKFFEGSIFLVARKEGNIYAKHF